MGDHNYYLANQERLKQAAREHYKNNKERHKINSKKWCEDNREKSRDIKRKYKEKQKQILRDLSRSLKTKCSNCPCDNPDCIDWHHLENKDILISRMIKHAYGTERFLQEIAKCIPLCSNCHRKHHFPNLPIPVNNSKGRYVNDLKHNSSCKHCPESYHQCLDFHHREPSDKVANISVIVRQSKYSMEDLLDEIAKCDIVCVNCHRLL
jgi:hypothetical protein